jgi:hypothetical protein
MNTKLPLPDDEQPYFSIGLKWDDWKVLTAACLFTLRPDLAAEEPELMKDIAERHDDLHRVLHKIRECILVVNDCIDRDQPFLSHFD